MTAELSKASLINEAKAFHPKKRLGQHFLVDVEALEAIVDALDPKPGETIIEVGPGIGFLTRLLAKSSAEHIIAVDLDRESIQRLEEFDLPKTELKHGDFLHFDLNTVQFFRKQRNEDGVEPAPPPERIKVVGNVPYQITGPIIGHLLGELDKPSPWIGRIDTIVLTVQYEVAQRMVAKAGDKEYSRVSLLVQQYCVPEMVSFVPSEAFFPAPRVGSAIVRMTPRPKPAVTAKNMQLLRKLIQAGFRQRRKMFRNAITFLRIEQADIDRVFAKLSLDPLVRAERLSLNQFAMLADALEEIAPNAQAEDDSVSEDQSDL